MAVKFQLRRDTAANWTAANPVLDLGEPGVETDTLKLKIGDGSTPWNSLDYSVIRDFAELANKPTTLAGYGITDAATSAQGALADTALQPGDGLSGAFTGDVTGSVFADDSTVMIDGVAATVNLTNNNITDLSDADQTVQTTDDVAFNSVDANIITNLIDSSDSSAITVTPDVVLSAGLTVGNHVVPSSSENIDLGSASARFRDLYLSGNSAIIGDLALKRHTSGGLLVADHSTGDPTNITTHNVTANDITAAGDVDVTGNLTMTGYIAGPATFTIDPAAVGDNTGTVVIAGDLQVDGTTTTINSTTLEVDDKNVVLATGSVNKAASDGAGITIDNGSDTDATFTYSGTNDAWHINKNLGLNYNNPQNNIHVLGTSGSPNVGITLQSHDTANATATLSLYARDASNVNQTVNIQNNLGKLYIDSLVGIGTDDPTYLLDAHTSSGNAQFRLKSGGDLAQIILESTDTSGNSQINFADADSSNVGMLQYFHSDNHMEITVNSAETHRITSSGNLLLNQNTIIGRNTADDSDNGYLAVVGGGAESDGRAAIARFYGNEHATEAGNLALSSGNISGSQISLRAAGNNTAYVTSNALMVGTTDSTPYNNNSEDTTDNGIALGATGIISAAKYNDAVVLLNRTGNDGNIIDLKKNGLTKGSIGHFGGATYINGNTHGVLFNGSSLEPVALNGSRVNNTVDIGSSSYRFNDVFLDGSVSTGSRNALSPTTFGYSASWKALILGSTGTDYQTDAVTISMGYDPSGNASGSYTGTGGEILFRNNARFLQPNDTDDGYLNTFAMNNGDVGIGETDPSAKLDVNDDGVTDNAWNTLAKFRPDLSDNPAETSIHIQSYPSTTVVENRKAGIQSIDDAGTVRPLILNKDGGNIGIGIDSPDTTVHIRSANIGPLKIDGSNGNGAYIRLRDDTTSADPNHVWIGVQGNDTKFYQSNSLLSMIIKSDGKVGIGDTPASPTRELMIRNDTPSGNTGIHIHNNSNSHAAIIELEGKRATDDQDIAQLLMANNGNNVTNIRAERQSDDGANLVFYTSTTGSGDVLTKRLNIGHNGIIATGTAGIRSEDGSNNQAAGQIQIQGNSLRYGTITNSGGGRSTLGWYQWGATSGTSINYIHMKTSLWAGGAGTSVDGFSNNSQYAMIWFNLSAYRYTTAGTAYGQIGFHNWNGSIANPASFGSGDWTDLANNVYVAADGHVVLVARINGNYGGFTVDMHQPFNGYPTRDFRVTAVTTSGTNTGAY